MFYVYRCCTTDKLEHHLNRVTEAGDEVFTVQYLGGRDWTLICRRTPDPTAPEGRRLCEVPAGEVTL